MVAARWNTKCSAIPWGWEYQDLKKEKDMSSIVFQGIHPQSLTWNLKMMISKRNLLSRGWFSGSMLNFRGVCEKKIGGVKSSIVFQGICEKIIRGSKIFHSFFRCVKKTSGEYVNTCRKIPWCFRTEVRWIIHLFDQTWGDRKRTLSSSFEFSRIWHVTL